MEPAPCDHLTTPSVLQTHRDALGNVYILPGGQIVPKNETSSRSVQAEIKPINSAVLGVCHVCRRVYAGPNNTRASRRSYEFQVATSIL